MKKIINFVTLALIAESTFAQIPFKMNYQAVVRDSNNNLVVNQTIGVQINILQGSFTGTLVYTETQTPKTNANGLLTLELGDSLVFDTISWNKGPFFINTQIDIKGGTDYSINGTSQLLSVPFAFHAKTAESVTGGISETDPVFNTSVASGITISDTLKWNNMLTSESQNLSEVISMNNSADNQFISNLADPLNEQDAATKAYVDKLATKVSSLENALINSGLFNVEDSLGMITNIIRTVDIYPGDDINLKTALYRDSCLYLFHTGIYSISEGVILYDYSNVIFRGEGSVKLIFNNPGSIFCFEIIGDLKNVIIDGLEICAPDTVIANAQNKYGIGSWSSATNIINLTVANCYFHTLNAGICIATALDGVFTEVKITKNIIENMTGYGPGRGYGIVNSHGRNIIISGNKIINTARHAIYQAEHKSDDMIIIENNFIENHDSVFTNPNSYAAQLAVARSNNVIVRDNTLVNSKTIALSVEYDASYTPDYLVENITLRKNFILNADFYGIWIYALTSKPLLDCNKITVSPNGSSVLEEYSVGYDTTSCSY